MNIVFLTRHVWPHLGGVETHVRELGKRLSVKGERVKIISEKDIKFPHIKFVGLIYTWFWLFRNRNLIEDCNIVHIHDVFLWYLPFRFIYPNKKVYVTIHGWEGKWPLRRLDILMKRLAVRLSTGSIAVGKYIEKYYGIKTNKIIYGGVEKNKIITTKKEKSVIFLGRLEKDAGVYEFIKKLKVKSRALKVEFVGDGSLRKECEKYGTVHGFCDPKPFLHEASICFAGGYLSALEALEYGCELWTGSDTPIKKDYWKTFPYKSGDKLPSWKDVANIYESLYLHNS